MEKERRVKALAIVVLVIAVLGLTIAFAALSQTLTINGSAYLNATKWGIKFENLSSPIKVGDATVTGEAKINESTYVEIANMNVNLKTPGDSVTYNVELVNEGTINAKIEKIEKTVLTEEQAKYLSFKVIKEDGQELNEGYILGKETRIPLTIKIEFKKDITKEDLPKETSEITLSYKINFVQTDEKIVTTGQGNSASKTYSVGDEICLSEECFYVISDNGDTVTALAKYNLLVGNIYETSTGKLTEISTEIEGYGLQSIETKGSIEGSYKVGAIPFSNAAYWLDKDGNLLSKYGSNEKTEDGFYAESPYVFDENSLLYEPLKNYESYLKTTLGKTSVNTSLLSYEQAKIFGCDLMKATCDTNFSWIYSTKYWLGDCVADDYIYYISPDNYFNGLSYYHDVSTGLRPVITINKSEL